MITLELIEHGTNTGPKVQWSVAPRATELITFNGITYTVVAVIHDLDKDCVRVAMVDHAKVKRENQS